MENLPSSHGLRLLVVLATTALAGCGSDDDASSAGGTVGGTGAGGAGAASTSTDSGASTSGPGPTGGGAAASTSGTGGAACPAPPAGLPSGPLNAFAGNPLLLNGPEDYDYWKTGPRVILKEGPTTYRMWYEAVGDEAAGSLTRVAYATSTDGLTWTKQGPVLSPDESSWEKMEVSPNSILYEGGVYKLYYHGGGYFLPGDPNRYGNASVGIATSPDGLTWTKFAGNPVLSPGPAGGFDDVQTGEPRVLNLGTEYRMYYTGEHRDAANTQFLALGMATSPDGISWTKYSGNPIIPTGTWAGWGGAFIPVNGVWQLWHALDPNSSGLGYFWSSDGISWTAGASNPVLTPSSDPASPLTAVGDSVSGYRDGDTYRIMFSGFSSNLNGSGNRFEGICMASIVGPCP